MAASSLRVNAQPMAAGRLGSIHSALQTHTGRRVVVECVRVRPDAVGTVEQLLREELAAFKNACRQHANVFSYDSVCAESDRVLLCCADAPPARTLATLLRSFERLHTVLVRRYVHAIAHGLLALHQSGIYCGGVSYCIVIYAFHTSDVLTHHAWLCCSPPQVSLASIFICGNEVRIAACFPSIATIKSVQHQALLADDQISRSFLQRVATGSEAVQDLRSIAYVMTELLTGTRVRGSSLDKQSILGAVSSDSLEFRFLCDLFELTRDGKADHLAQRLVEHEYLQSNTQVDAVVPWGQHGALPDSLHERCQVIVAATQQEYAKCVEMKERHVHDIRTWFALFEKRYQKKPTMAERPVSIVRLEVRCRTLTDRIHQLEARMATVQGSFSGQQGTPDDENTEGRAKPLNSVEKKKMPSLPMLDLALDHVVDQKKRSPAQNAFLKRLEAPSGDATTSDAPRSPPKSPPRSPQHDREIAHQLLHQRKQVQQVIEGILTIE